MKAAIFVLKFFFISALIIVSNENLALKEDTAREEFVGYYAQWIGGVFKNMGQMTGYVVESRWLPDTETFLGPSDDSG